MGSNQRYANHYDKLAADRITETFIVKDSPLGTLTPDELALDRLPVTIYPEGHRPKVKAWVRFGDTAVRVDAVVARSTSKAAGIEFDIRGTSYRCWVWGNAVDLA